jgi:hypothetical protein
MNGADRSECGHHVQVETASAWRTGWKVTEKHANINYAYDDKLIFLVQIDIWFTYLI